MSLQTNIKTFKQQLSDIEQIVNEQRALIESMTPADPRYNLAIEEYNNEVEIFNAKLANIDGLINLYNSQVKAFDACIMRGE
jgi:chromosome segregation ATPase